MSLPQKDVPVLPWNERFGLNPSEEVVEETVRNLRERGHTVIVVKTREEAAQAVRGLLPEGAEVFNATSRTLDEIGISEELAAEGKYHSLRAQVAKMDRAKEGHAIHKLLAAPDYVVGSVHAVTQKGDLVIASATGSQLGLYAYTAGKAIWVIGTQKIVPDLDSAFHRVHEYSYPFEDARARKAYGRPSSVNKLLVIHREAIPGRTTVVLVREHLGF